ncbi:MAG: exodeoxyribonuclease V subunit alpha, partial [Leucothrix sp.]
DNIIMRLGHQEPLPMAVASETVSDTLLDKYFPALTHSGETDWQREAAKSAAKQAFTIITGGPGTGKTSTVLKILMLLQELHQGALAISLAAPTGKAAMRLQQSLVEGKQQSVLQGKLLDSIPETVTTLHRLLGPINQSNHFRHHVDNPLSCDVLVVDESSMIDLALMSKLLDALPAKAKIILLGDKDQLASVESGAVLNDLCVSLPEQTIELKKTWRFSGAIKDLAQAINKQQAVEAWSLLSAQTEAAAKHPLQDHVALSQMRLSFIKPEQQYSLFDELGAHIIPQFSEGEMANDVEESTIAQLPNEQALDYIYERYQPYIAQIIRSADPAQALSAFLQFQVLAAVRQGPFGVEGLNRSLEKRLYSSQMQTHLPWYHGKPVMITRNDPALGLFNGDIGICLRDEKSAQLDVWFNESNGNFRAVLPARLPLHETVFAMTIHKSQGSEFDDVLIVLPEQSVALLSKELLYTGVTRAKQQVAIAAHEWVFSEAINQQVVRHSGIPHKIQAAMYAL